jgi:hypothetical protein
VGSLPSGQYATEYPFYASFSLTQTPGRSPGVRIVGRVRAVIAPRFRRSRAPSKSLGIGPVEGLLPLIDGVKSDGFFVMGRWPRPDSSAHCYHDS